MNSNNDYTVEQTIIPRKNGIPNRDFLGDPKLRKIARNETYERPESVKLEQFSTHKPLKRAKTIALVKTEGDIILPKYLSTKIGKSDSITLIDLNFSGGLDVELDLNGESIHFEDLQNHPVDVRVLRDNLPTYSLGKVIIKVLTCAPNRPSDNFNKISAIEENMNFSKIVEIIKLINSFEETVLLWTPSIILSSSDFINLIDEVEILLLPTKQGVQEAFGIKKTVTRQMSRAIQVEMTDVRKFLKKNNKYVRNGQIKRLLGKDMVKKV
jgi:hypothetical protein